MPIVAIQEYGPKAEELKKELHELVDKAVTQYGMEHMSVILPTNRVNDFCMYSDEYEFKSRYPQSNTESGLRNEELANFFIQSVKNRKPINSDFIIQLSSKIMNNDEEFIRETDSLVGELTPYNKDSVELVKGIEHFLIDNNQSKNPLAIAGALHNMMVSTFPIYAQSNVIVARYLTNYFLFLNGYNPILLNECNEDIYRECLKDYLHFHEDTLTEWIVLQQYADFKVELSDLNEAILRTALEKTN